MNALFSEINRAYLFFRGFDFPALGSQAYGNIALPLGMNNLDQTICISRLSPRQEPYRIPLKKGNKREHSSRLFLSYALFTSFLTKARAIAR
jgi:hypothetical protein